MKCFISIVHQHCDDLRISRSPIPEGSVWRGWKDTWFLASFAGGSGCCSRSFFTHFLPLFQVFLFSFNLGVDLLFFVQLLLLKACSVSFPVPTCAVQARNVKMLKTIRSAITAAISSSDYGAAALMPTFFVLFLSRRQSHR